MTEIADVHQPVLPLETLEALSPHAGGTYVDGTVGMGGHAQLILERSSPDGLLFGFDRDAVALQLAAARLARFEQRTQLLHTGYEHAESALKQRGVTSVDGILLDLGLSSLQLDSPARGFSYQATGPIDMRFDQSQGEPAAALVNEWPESDLAEVLWRLGEEPASRRIAKSIVRARPVMTTAALAAIVVRAAGRPRERSAAAARTFQALRIAVNNELSNLGAALEQAQRLLALGGRLVVISFHSLEDRIVKQFLQRESRDCICPPGLPECRCGHLRSFTLLVRGAVRPGEAELRSNPRSRSARLRAAARV